MNVLARQPEWPYFVGALFLASVCGIALAMQGYLLSIPIAAILTILFTAFWLAPTPKVLPTRPLRYIFMIYILTFLLWPRYVAIHPAGLPNINLQRIVYLPLIFITIAALFWAKPFSSTLKSRLSHNWYATGLLTLLLIWKALSVLFSVNVASSFYGIVDEIVSYFLVFIISLVVIQDKVDVYRISIAILIGGMLACCLGMYEAIAGHNVFAKYFPVSAEYVAMALSNKIREGEYRIQSTFEHPLLFAEFLVFLLPLAFFFVANGKRSIHKMLGWISLPLILYSMYHTGSRAGLGIVMAIGLFMYIFVFGRKILVEKLNNVTVFFLLMLPLVILVAVTVLPDFFYNLVHGNSVTSRSTTARVIQFKLATPIILNNLSFGIGVRNAASSVGYVSVPGGSVTLDSYFLTIALESGIPALIMFVLLMTYFIFLGFGSPSKKSDGRLRLANALSFSLLGMFIFKSVLSLPQNFPLIFLAFAMLLVLNEDTTNSNT